MKLTGKVALVTGTSPNIGGGIAEGLAAEGASVACVDSRAENAADCARYIGTSGGRAIAPASIRKSIPVIIPASSEARNAAARP